MGYAVMMGKHLIILQSRIINSRSPKAPASEMFLFPDRQVIFDTLHSPPAVSKNHLSPHSSSLPILFFVIPFLGSLYRAARIPSSLRKKVSFFQLFFLVCCLL